MFYEFALEPTVLSSWERVRYFLDAFGPWKGRFLAEYPRKWKRMVYDGLTCPDIEKKRIEERLARLEKRVFSRRVAATAYDGTRPWLANAEAEHSRQPFRAIVAAAGSSSGAAHVLSGADVDETDERWRVDVGRLVSREPAMFVQALRLLLDASQRLIIIDPYFRADQDDKTRPLAAFCRAVGTQATVEVHFSDEPRGYEPCMRDAARALPNLLPDGLQITLHCWKERPAGPRLHNRYLLTDIGGVKFGDGIEMGDAGQEDHLSILDEPSRLKLWNQYIGPAIAFDSGGVPQRFVGARR
jgi:hypothetical protein